MKKILTLGMVAALLAFACAAHAYPTLAGPTGLIQAPTAMVVAPGSFDLAVDYDASKNKETFENDSYPLRAQFGVGGGLEIGGGYDVSAFDGKGFWNVNAKYQLPYSFCGMTTAVGALYGEARDIPVWGGGTTEIKATQVYFAGTNHFDCIIPLSVTLGVNWTQLEENNKQSGVRAQIGVEAKVFQDLALVGDIQSSAKNMNPYQKNLWSAGARYAFTPELKAEAGVTNGLFNGMSSRANFFVGMNLAFGNNAK